MKFYKYIIPPPSEFNQLYYRRIVDMDNVRLASYYLTSMDEWYVNIVIGNSVGAYGHTFQTVEQAKNYIETYLLELGYSLLPKHLEVLI
jgi:hypothetical protein